MRQNDDGKTVAAMDMLVPGIGEIIGGSQRESASTLKQKCADFDIPKTTLVVPRHAPLRNGTPRRLWHGI